MPSTSLLSREVDDPAVAPLMPVTKGGRQSEMTIRDKMKVFADAVAESRSPGTDDHAEPGDYDPRPNEDAQEFIEKVVRKFNEKGQPRLSYPEVLAGLLMRAKLDDEQLNEEDAKSVADAAASFMLNVGVVCTLLFGVQVGVAMSEAQPWPLLDWFAGTCLDKMHMGTITLTYDELYKSSSVSSNHTWISREPIEINIFINLLQQFSTLWLLRWMYPNLLIIATSTKAYGHLTWWTSADPMAMRLLLCTDHIMGFQDKLNGLLPNFCISLCPYLFLTRGPIVALAVFIMSRWIQKDFQIFDRRGQMLLYVHFATRMQRGKMFKK